MQLNKDIQKTDLSKKEKSNTDLSNNHSIPILSPNPSPLRENAAEPERKGTEAKTQSAVEIYRDIIKDNIEYDILTQDPHMDKDRLDEIVPFPVSWTVKMKKKQKETQDILSYHTQAAGCSDKARAKASGGRQPIEECGRTGL